MNFSSWIIAFLNAPLAPYWMSSLAFAFLGALLVLALLSRSVFVDRAELKRFRDLPQEPKGTPWAKAEVATAPARGALADWRALLASRRERDQPSGAEQLLSVLSARYDWADPWLTVLRSSCTLIGLLFTFVGLAMTLGQLSGALNMGAAPGAAASSQVDIVTTLNNVRNSLPGLGTAFGASITGILASLLIGLLWALVAGAQAEVASGIARFSAERMEPLYAPPTGDQQVSAFMEQQAIAIQKGFEGVIGALKASKEEEAQRYKQQVDTLAAAAQAMVRTSNDSGLLRAELKHLGTVLTGNPEEVKKVWTTALSLLEAQQKTMVTALTEAADTAGAQIVATAKVAGEHLMGATTTAASTLQGSLERARTELDAAFARMTTATQHGTLDLAAAIAKVRTEGQAALTSIQGVQTALATSAERFSAALGKASQDLQVSAVHVSSLATTAQRLSDLLKHTEDLLAVTQARQLEDTRRLAVAFETIPIMAEAVTRAASSSVRAAETLQTVVAGEDMARYLSSLPALIHLSESERASREALQLAADSFTETATSVGELNRHVQRISQTSQGLQRAHEQVAEVLLGLARDQLGPAVRALVQQAATTVLQQSDQSWSQRHQTHDEQQHIVLVRFERDMARLADAQQAMAGSQQALANSQQALISWFQRPYWSRLLGRQDDR